MKLLLDINVLLDVVLQREPWAESGAEILAAIEQGKATGFVAAHTITTAYYITARAQGRAAAVQVLSDLLRLVEVVPVERADFYQALALGIPDFEDAVQAVCALKVDADFIVTRNEKDFQGGSIPARPPSHVTSVL